MGLAVASSTGMDVSSFLGGVLEDVAMHCNQRFSRAAEKLANNPARGQVAFPAVVHGHPVVWGQIDGPSTAGKAKPMEEHVGLPVRQDATLADALDKKRLYDDLVLIVHGPVRPVDPIVTPQLQHANLVGSFQLSH